MDSCFPVWNTEVEVGFPLSCQIKPQGLDHNELVELLWQNGEVVLQSQNHRKSTHDSTKFNSNQNPNNPIQDDETASWIHCPIDEAFEKNFCTKLLSQIPPSPDFASISLPPPRSAPFGSPHEHQNLGGGICNIIDPLKGQGCSHMTQNEIPGCSDMTIGSSHCGSNQVVNEVDMGRESKRIFRPNEKTGVEMLERPMASSSGGSGSSGVWKTSNQSNETIRHKRKSRDMEESECKSDGTELESASRIKSSQKSGTTRKSRVAEVHNMSERRRRDRINDKMKALQELIPNSKKSDKASVLDEAIEYMKSLQLQLKFMWMGRGMAPMMIPGMQQYMSRIGMGLPTLPQVQDLMRLSRFPVINQTNITVPPVPNQTTIAQNAMLNYQNQMLNPCLPEQYANYMGFPSMQNPSQPINMFNFGSHSAQPSHVLARPSNDNGYFG